MTDTPETAGRRDAPPIDIHGLIARLFPICSSLTGEGPRTVLRTLRETIPLEMREIPTGRQVFDWTIPQEWVLRDAFIQDSRGERIIDLRKSNLHVMSYSVPVDAEMDLEDLKKRIHTLPDRPDWIPYRTSYYNKDWAFCATQSQVDALKPGRYKVRIDSEHKDGSLTYGELTLPGRSADTVLLTSYICHPSMGNDNLSGVGVLAAMAARLMAMKDRRLTYRCIFVPETIGAIAWLSENRQKLAAIKAGLVFYCCGDRGETTFKRSRRKDSAIDRAAEIVLGGGPGRIIPFNPTGSDERQFCSPGINLPLGGMMRTPNSEFDEYHTSADDLDFISAPHLDDTYRKAAAMIEVLERDRTWVNQAPFCEPQLGKRGLYRTVGGQKTNKVGQTALKWVLNYSDGGHSLSDIALLSGIGFTDLADAGDALAAHGLLKEAAT